MLRRNILLSSLGLWVCDLTYNPDPDDEHVYIVIYHHHHLLDVFQLLTMCAKTALSVGNPLLL